MEIDFFNHSGIDFDTCMIAPNLITSAVNETESQQSTERHGAQQAYLIFENLLLRFFKTFYRCKRFSNDLQLLLPHSFSRAVIETREFIPHPLTQGRLLMYVSLRSFGTRIY